MRDNQFCSLTEEGVEFFFHAACCARFFGALCQHFWQSERLGIALLRGDVGTNGLNFRSVDKGTLNTHRTVAGKEEQVALSDELIGARAIENGLTVDALRHFEGHSRWEVGLDGSGDDVGGRSLGGYYHVDTHCTCQLGNTCNRQLYLLACCHDQVTELIDDYHYVGQEPMPVVGIELAVSELLICPLLRENLLKLSFLLDNSQT